ncbi:DHA2 family efflux MFS transporter permease subunit [Pedobacter sp. HMF7647]|uniref:DHA2 family efflux MFS transporter permease subunit n=1 Tax=Hufsiella arboris TaxID=2695275 RepID=A0A7K1YFS9_9SPHI|nr:MFS transporter [Hufsiella arboris]MXV52978.1 DHA2 family efflux MFS transporter permease subunit [Hufsiella arboris]
METLSLSSSKGKWLMASTILASSMAFIDGTALNVVLPALQKSLNATGADLFWILNAYLLMLASLILIGGSLGDKLGRKKIFMIGILIFIAGSVACGFSSTVFMLILCRVVQGIGGALMIPGSLSLISSTITGKERGKAIGTWSSATTVVTIGGPILGGALADAGLWRYIFFINVPIGIVALAILFFKVDENRDNDSDSSIDFLGAIAIVLGLAALTFGFLRMPSVGISNWQVYSTLVLGLFLLVIFIIIERKSKYPMMPLTLFKNQTFTGANLLTFFLYAGLGAGMLFLSLNLVQAQAYSQLQSGLTFLPFTILMILLARISGGLADKYGPRLFLITGPAIAGCGLLWLSFVKQTSGPQDYWSTFFPGILTFGLGMSLTVAPLTTAVMGSAEDHFSGTASGVNNAMTRISNVFANAIFGALAVLFFTAALQKDLDKTSFSSVQKEEILIQAVNLGNAKVPDTINKKWKNSVEQSLKDGFITSYGYLMKLAASLAFLASLMAVVFIRNKHINT